MYRRFDRVGLSRDDSHDKDTFIYVFFFQAEDGIRDHCVTGVQTCALPISRIRALRVGSPDFFGQERIRPGFDQAIINPFGADYSSEVRARLEEHVFELCALLSALLQSESRR